MGKNVQVRDVPDAVHRALKQRAAQRGMSLTEFLRVELEMIAARPAPEELLESLLRGPVRKVPRELRGDAIIRKLRGPLP